MKKIITAVFLAGCSFIATAAEINGQYPVCTSRESFDKLQAILKHSDEAAFKRIMKTECFMPKEGMPVEKVVSRGWTDGVAQLKIYADGDLYDVWTNTESLKK